MTTHFESLPFRPADILLPRDCDLSLWSVVACDQYTSQPEYWQRVEERVGRAPSSLRLILPESCLEGPDVETDIMEINNTMTRYLREQRFTLYPDTLIYVERTLEGGKIRRGLVGMVDLEQYDYEPGGGTLIRATEGVVLSRIPPRVAVRKNAPIELPHAMLLTDDPEQTVIEPVSKRVGELEKLYDFDLMEGGGHLRGWRLDDQEMARVAQAMKALARPDHFHSRYGLKGEEPVLLFAVGDGNHSLAAAKECYERAKRITEPEQWPNLPSRFALCELVNLYDPVLVFQPIYRVVFGVDPKQLLAGLAQYYPQAVWGKEDCGSGRRHRIRYVYDGGEGTVTVPNPKAHLTAGTLQNFLDEFLAHHLDSRIDYVHGEGVASHLARSHPDAVAFLLPALKKEELFPTVIHDGVLPRKTFSVGRAQDKRFYLEARRIRS